MHTLFFFAAHFGAVPFLPSSAESLSFLKGRRTAFFLDATAGHLSPPPFLPFFKHARRPAKRDPSRLFFSLRKEEDDFSSSYLHEGYSLTSFMFPPHAEHSPAWRKEKDL